MGRIMLIKVISAIAVLNLIMISSPIAKPKQVFDPATLLPKGAKIAKVATEARETDWLRERTDLMDAVFYDPWEHSTSPQVVVFYTRDQAAVVSLYQWDAPTDRFIKQWDHSAFGVSFDSMSGVWDINGDGRKEIVAFRWIGASAGGTFDIFAWDGTTLKRINPDWNVDINRTQLVDLDGDGRPEIILSHRFELPSIYRWDGSRYRQANEDFPELFQEKTEEYARLAMDESLSAGDIAGFCKNAVQGFLYQKRYSDAMKLCREVLEIPKVKGNKIALSIAYISLGDIYRARGQFKQAIENYERAVSLYPSGEAKKKLDDTKRFLQKTPHQ